MSIRSVLSCSLLAVAVAACASPTVNDDGDAAGRRRPRAPDASVPAADAAPTPTTSSGIVSCYREGDPSATCSAPQVCCFSNYSAQHNGACSSSTCAWGTISCDGPEDCGSGQLCCAHGNWDPDWGMQGWTLACSATACGAPPLNRELCHPGGAPCSGGKSCVSAYGVANDLPRTLYVCN